VPAQTGHGLGWIIATQTEAVAWNQLFRKQICDRFSSPRFCTCFLPLLHTPSRSVSVLFLGSLPLYPNSTHSLLLHDGKDSVDHGVELGLAIHEPLALRFLGVHQGVPRLDFKVSSGAIVVDQLHIDLDALRSEHLLQEALALPRARPVPSAAAILQTYLNGRHG